MRCPNCNALMPRGTKFCTECGTRLPVQDDLTPNVPYQSQQPAPEPAPTAPAATLEDFTGRMKWHKFLIYFALWLGALQNIGAAAANMTGSAYGDSVDYVYAFFPGLKILDVAFGICTLALAVFNIYTRYRLARFRRNGPACLSAAYLAALIVSVLYLAVGTAICKISLLNVQTGVSLAMSLIFLILNRSYYRKRKHLFVN